MKNIVVIIICALILTSCNSSEVNDMEMGTQSFEADELEILTTENANLLEINGELEAELSRMNEVVISLREEIEDNNYWTFDKALIVDMDFNTSKTMAMFSIYDSGPFSGIYIYEVDGKKLSKLDGIGDAYCEWCPFDDLLLCYQGTYITRSGYIYSAISKECISTFSFIGDVYWLNKNEILYENFNEDMIVENGSDFPYTTDIIKYNIYNSDITYVLRGTVDFSYHIKELEGELVITREFENEEKSLEVVNFSELPVLNNDIEL